MREPEAPATGKRRFVLYDFDAGQLATTRLFDTYAEAVDETDRLSNVLIIPIDIPQGGEDVAADDEADDPRCDCELPGFYHCGVPGILAHFVKGRLAPGAGVEHCDLCQRYPTDEAALQKLQELGLA